MSFWNLEKELTTLKLIDIIRITIKNKGIMRITKMMVNKSIVKHGMKKYIRVGENPSSGYIVIIIPYEYPDVSLFHNVSSLLKDIELSNKLEIGCLDKSEVKIYPKEIWVVIK